MMIVMKTFWTIFLVASLAAIARAAETPKNCAVCQQAIKDTFSWMDSATVRERQAVCKHCSSLEDHCFVCGLPVKSSARKLEDGRWICPRDEQAGVFDQREAERIFHDVQRDVLRIFSGMGVLPTRNITVSLVDGAVFEQVHKKQRSFHDKSLTMGLTQTRMKGREEFDHHIYLINGLGPARLAAVAAHEWAHTWIHQNVPGERQVDGDTVEGFCELVAYKVMSQRGEELEKKVIMANAYTRGQVSNLVKAEDDYQFYRVVEWMKAGVDAKFDATNTARVLVLGETPSPATPTVAWLPQATTPVPDKLTLKGISGTAQRRFALINDRTMAKHELGKVRVGDSNVVVRCLDITDHSVVLELKDSAQRTELFLRAD